MPSSYRCPTIHRYSCKVSMIPHGLIFYYLFLEIIQAHINDKLILREQVEYMKEDLNRSVQDISQLSQDNEKFRTICRELSENNKKQQIQIAQLSSQLLSTSDSEKQRNLNLKTDEQRKEDQPLNFEIILQENSQLRKINEDLLLTIERSRRLQSMLPESSKQQSKNMRLKSNKPENLRIGVDEVQKFISTIDDYPDQNDKLQKENNYLKQNNENLQFEIEQLQASIQLIKIEKDNVLIMNKSQQDQIQQMIKDINNGKKTTDDDIQKYLKEEILRQQKANQDLTEQMKSQTRLQFARLEQLNKEKAEVEESQQKNLDLQTQIHHLNQYCSTMEKKYQNEILKLIKTNEDFQSQSQSSKQGFYMNELPEQTTNYQEEISRLKNINIELKAQIDNLQLQLTGPELQQNYKNLQNSKNQENVKNLTEQLNKSQIIQEELKQRVEQLVKELFKLKQEQNIGNPSEEIGQLQSINENLQKSLKQEFSLRRDDQNEIIKLRNVNNELQSQLLYLTSANNEQQILKLSQNNSIEVELREEIMKFKKTNGELQIQKEQLESQLNSFLKNQNQADFIRSLQEEIIFLKQNSSVSEKQRNQSLTIQNQQLEIQLKDIQSKNKNLNLEMDQRTQDVMIKAEIQKNTQNELDSLKKINQGLVLQIERQNVEIRIQSSKSDGRSENSYLYQTQQIFQQQKNEFEIVVETLQKELQSKKEMCERLQSQTQILEKDLVKKQQELEEFQSQFGNRDSYARRYSLDMNQNQRVIQQLRSIQEEQITQIGSYQVKLIAVENKNQVLTQQIEQLQKIIAESQQVLNSSGNNNERVQKYYNIENAQLQVQIKSLQQELELLLNSHNQIFSGMI